MCECLRLRACVRACIILVVDPHDNGDNKAWHGRQQGPTMFATPVVTGKDDGNKTSGRSVVCNNQKSGVGSTLPRADEVGFQSILMTLLRLVLTLPSMQEKDHQRRPRGVPLV